MSATGLLLDALGDAHKELVELSRFRAEVTKLRRLVVKQLCDCRTCAVNMPLEPYKHRLTCTYRREMQ